MKPLHYLVFDGTSYWVTDAEEALNSTDVDFIQSTSYDLDFLNDMADGLNDLL